MLQQQQIVMWLLLLFLPSHSAHRCAVSLDLRLSQMHFHACILQILLLPHTLTHFSIQLLYCTSCGSPTVHCGANKALFYVVCCQCRASIDFRTFVARLAWSLSRAVIAHLDTLLATASTCTKLACSSFSNLNANWGGAHYIWTISFDRQMSLTRW